jgi:hypothetical protein
MIQIRSQCLHPTNMTTTCEPQLMTHQRWLQSLTIAMPRMMTTWPAWSMIGCYYPRWEVWERTEKDNQKSRTRLEIPKERSKAQMVSEIVVFIRLCLIRRDARSMQDHAGHVVLRRRLLVLWTLSCCQPHLSSLGLLGELLNEMSI